MKNSIYKAFTRVKSKVQVQKSEGFNLAILYMSAISVVVLVVVVSIGARILQGLQNGTNETTEPTAYALIGEGLTGLAEYGNWFTLIVLVTVGVVLIRLLLVGFSGMGSSRGE